MINLPKDRFYSNNDPFHATIVQFDYVKRETIKQLDIATNKCDDNVTN